MIVGSREAAEGLHTVGARIAQAILGEDSHLQKPEMPEDAASAKSPSARSPSGRSLELTSV